MLNFCLLDRKCGDKLYGYTIDQVGEIPDIDAHVTRLTHNETGAQHLHIAREDNNNTFRYVYKLSHNFVNALIRI